MNPKPIKKHAKPPKRVDCRGTFNIRIDPSLHFDCALIAYLEQRSLNSVIHTAVNQYVAAKGADQR